MNKRVIVYGYADKSSKGFKKPSDLINYLKKELFRKNNCRHHYTQTKKADIIVVSRDGYAYGHMVIKDLEKPNSKDIKCYAKTKTVYIVNSTAVYKNPVKLNEFGINRIQFGKSINSDEFKKIKHRAGKIEYFHPR